MRRLVVCESYRHRSRGMGSGSVPGTDQPKVVPRSAWCSQPGQAERTLVGLNVDRASLGTNALLHACIFWDNVHPSLHTFFHHIIKSVCWDKSNRTVRHYSHTFTHGLAKIYIR
uniref:(northern house mosquito) hypothetical protein n=1 Tax=Culex pipiens TaxID=7175 RepID=A0A8D7ZYP1_CULPI